MARFNGLGACVRFRFEERNGEFSIFKDWPYATEPEPAYLIDLTFAYLLESGRRGTSQDIKPVSVSFSRSGPETNVHEARFGCPLRFEAPRNMLVLKSVDLERQFRGHNAEFLDLFTPALAEALDGLSAKCSIGTQVKWILKRMLASGPPEVADVARPWNERAHPAASDHRGGARRFAPFSSKQGKSSAGGCCRHVVGNGRGRLFAGLGHELVLSRLQGLGGHNAQPLASA